MQVSGIWKFYLINSVMLSSMKFEKINIISSINLLIIFSFNLVIFSCVKIELAVNKVVSISPTIKLVSIFSILLFLS